MTDKIREEYISVRESAVALARSKGFTRNTSSDSNNADARRWFNGLVAETLVLMGTPSPNPANHLFAAKLVKRALYAQAPRAMADSSPFKLHIELMNYHKHHDDDEIWYYDGPRNPIGGRWLIGRGTMYGHPTQEAAQARLDRIKQKEIDKNEAVDRVRRQKAQGRLPRWGLSMTGSASDRARYAAPLMASVYREADAGYDYVDILRLLDRADPTSYQIAYGLLDSMIARQTQEEQAAETALVDNKLGLSKTDAAVAARIMRELQALTDETPEHLLPLHYQMVTLLSNYARRQLPDIMNQLATQYGYALRTNPSHGRGRGRGLKKNPQATDIRWYQAILAMLRAIQWKAWTLHWQVGGPNYYGDHLLLQRLYDGEGGGPVINDAIDALGERMVSYFGPESVDAETINTQAGVILRETLPGFAGLLDLETRLQKGIRSAWKMNQEGEGENFSLGMDDYLMGLSNERDTVIYLLKQRLRK